MAAVSSPLGQGRKTSPACLLLLLGPALIIITVLFGGGLTLGFFQALDYLPGQGFDQIGLQHFTHVLQDPDFFNSLGISLYISITSTLIAAAVSVVLFVYNWKEIPFITFMLLAVLKNVGSELDEVGATLNGSKTQRFRYITLPIISPSLGGACLIVFAFTFGAFEVPYLLGRTYPMALPVWAYKNYSDIDLLARPEGIAIAIGMILAAIITMTIIFSQLLLQFSRNRSYDL